jgi:hypothetical protein
LPQALALRKLNPARQHPRAAQCAEQAVMRSGHPSVEQLEEVLRESGVQWIEPALTAWWRMRPKSGGGDLPPMRIPCCTAVRAGGRPGATCHQRRPGRSLGNKVAAAKMLGISWQLCMHAWNCLIFRQYV